MNNILKLYFLFFLIIFFHDAHSQSNDELIEISSYIRGAGGTACYNDERTISIEQYIIQPVDVYYKVINLSTCVPALAYAIDYEENNSSLKWRGNGIISSNLNSALIKLTENNLVINVEWKTVYHYPANECLPSKTITKTFKGNTQSISVIPLSQKPQIYTFTATSPVDNNETIGIKVNGCRPNEYISWEPSLANSSFLNGIYYLSNPMTCEEYKVKCHQFACNYEEKWSAPLKPINYFKPPNAAYNPYYANYLRDKVNQSINQPENLYRKQFSCIYNTI